MNVDECWEHNCGAGVCWDLPIRQATIQRNTTTLALTLAPQIVSESNRGVRRTLRPRAILLKLPHGRAVRDADDAVQDGLLEAPTEWTVRYDAGDAGDAFQ